MIYEHIIRISSPISSNLLILACLQISSSSGIVLREGVEDLFCASILPFFYVMRMLQGCELNFLDFRASGR